MKPGVARDPDRRRRVAIVIAVAAVGAMLVAVLVAAIVFIHGATSLPAVAHPMPAAAPP